MKEIVLSQGKVASVDDDDFEYLSQWKWHARKGKNTFYAARNTSRKNPPKIVVLMHRAILNLKNTTDIADHIDRNGLNNCKSNLRIATGTQNNANATSAKNSTSKYLGVYWYKTRNKWKSEITKNRKNICLGYFPTEEDAAFAYNQAAIIYHGEFANLNII